MAVFYLETDDEITSAAARIRAAKDIDVVLVLPAGSRIATSRINFRLLAREAAERSRRLAIVAPEASARALAASAGLPVFSSVVEQEEAAEAARLEGDEGPAGGTTAAGAVAGGGSRHDDAAPGAGPALAAGAALGAAGVAARRAGAHARPLPEPPAPTTAAPPAPRPAARTGVAFRDDAAGRSAAPGAGRREPPRGRGPVGPSTGLAAPPAGAPRGRRRWPLVIAALVAVLLLGGAGAAVGYVLLPSATVTLQLEAEPIGPIEFDGVADPEVVAVDAETATIPATRLAIPLSATGTYPATGTRVEEAAASGSVRWTNCNNSRAYTIPKGTVVRTQGGIGFATQDAILVPVAITTGAPPNIKVTCQSRDVDVRALRTGPAGNVAAGAIRVVPGTYDPILMRVTNPAATAGGLREEFPKVTQKDVVAAVADLTRQLDEQLVAVAAAPPGQPESTIAYPETARRGEPVPSTDPADLVDQEVESFELSLTADGTVVVADPTPLEAIGAARVAAQVPEGRELRDGSVRVEVGEGIVEDERIRYPVDASGESVPVVTEAEVRALVRGETPEAAEAALVPFGTAVVTVWPDWAETVTTIDARLEVKIEGVPPVASPPAEPTPATPAVTSAPALPSANPAASPGPSASPGATPAP